jgi:hypothetical protein
MSVTVAGVGRHTAVDSVVKRLNGNPTVNLKRNIDKLKKVRSPTVDKKKSGD